MPRINISFGPNRSAEIDVPEGSTLRDVLGDCNVRTILGFGDNVSPVVNGVPTPVETTVSGGDRVQLVNQAGSKA
jgi:sulfur carrier protein ThiS